MSVYKELFWTAEQVEKQSKRIYPDAADYGVPIFSNSDTLIMMVKQMIEQYDGKVTTESYGTGSTQTIVVSGYPIEERGAKLVTVTFIYTFIKEQYRGRGADKKMLGYLSVERSDRDLHLNW